VKHLKASPGTLNLRWAQRWSVALTGIALALSLLSLLEPLLLLAAGAALLAVVALNAGFYRFLRKARGTGFALAGVPLHLLHFACCGAGAGWALLTTRRLRRT
jgi:hypothetical protein